MPEYTVNTDSSIYYQGRYWNDLEAVREWLNCKVSGRPDCYWSQHFKERSGRRFQRALILNCGNGHVERGLCQWELISEGVGVDCSETLLEQARGEAERLGQQLKYHAMDVNTAMFPAGQYDLVVNHAAAHHIAYLDRVFRGVCRLLPEDGWFVSWDYVGPHRNQYTYEAWDAAWQLNRELPASLRQDMRYPHLPTMLASDPTEAIHSELILETFHRYFLVDEEAPLGGAVAYPLLTHNARFFAASDEERRPWLRRILEADERFLEAHPGSSLFAYFTGRPRKGALRREDQLARWAAEEEQREERARANGGEYYPHTALQALNLALED